MSLNKKLKFKVDIDIDNKDLLIASLENNIYKDKNRKNYKKIIKENINEYSNLYKIILFSISFFGIGYLLLLYIRNNI